MRKWPLVLVVAGVIVLAVGGFLVKELYLYPKAPVAVATNNTAPDFTLTDAEGKPFTLSSQRGHKVVLFFYRGYW